MLNVSLDHQAEDGRVTLQETFRRQVVSIGGGWNWLSIVSGGGFNNGDAEPSSTATCNTVPKYEGDSITSTDAIPAGKDK